MHAVHNDEHDDLGYVLTTNDKSDDAAIVAHIQCEDTIIRGSRSKCEHNTTRVCSEYSNTAMYNEAAM